jgi:predicted DNA-binding transcriptional regulator AlpA
MSQTSPKGKYLRVADVRRRYGGASDMWLVRKMREFGFPRPIYFGGRDRFWITEQLDEWDRAMIERGSTSQHGVAKRKAVSS